jgi:hypothetical protein
MISNRYTLDCEYSIDTEGSDQPTFKSNENGEWVLYEDLSELFARLEWLEKELTNTNARIIKARECLTK